MKTSYFVHTLHGARDWQDRPELSALLDWWRSGGYGALAITGIGGAGKTALVDRFLRIVPDLMESPQQVSVDPSLQSPAGLFVYSFYDHPNPEAFFDELYGWMIRTCDLPDRRSQEQHNRVSASWTLACEAMALIRPRLGGRLLLVLDGLEKMQESLDVNQFGRIIDRGILSLLLRIAGGHLPDVSVLLTTRYLIDDLESAHLKGRTPCYRTLTIDALPVAAAVCLLRDRGVIGNDEILAAVAKDGGHHALTLDLLASYLVKFHSGDPRGYRLQSIPDEVKNEACDTHDRAIREMAHQAAKLQHLAKDYQASLLASDPAALALLERICFFRPGVDVNTLESVFLGPSKEAISGVELAALNQKQLTQRLAWLHELHLIQAATAAHPTPVYSVHPAIRRAFSKAINPTVSVYIHHGIKSHLKTLAKPRDQYSVPQFLSYCEEYIHHSIMGGALDEAWQVYLRDLGGYSGLGHFFVC